MYINMCKILYSDVMEDLVGPAKKLSIANQICSDISYPVLTSGIQSTVVRAKALGKE